MLVGRQLERQAIDRLLSGARVGDSGALVLVGDPGIGKTALLTEAETLSAGMQVLRASGVESEMLVPFGGLLQLLRPLVHLVPDIPAPQAAALSAALLLTGDESPRTSRFAVGAATLSLLSRAAEDRPIAVLLDDSHLLDEPSTQALSFAARRLISDPVAFLVATRPTEPGSRAWASLPSLRVCGLDEQMAKHLVSEATTMPLTDSQLRRLHHVTGGNPLALLELAHDAHRLEGLRGLPEDTPLTVSAELTRSFLGRAEELDDQQRLALLVASAGSRSAEAVGRACRLLGGADGGLSAAEDLGLVTVTEDEVQFRHPLIRSAVYGAAVPSVRRQVHRALAAVVTPDEVERLAWHLSEGASGPDDTTADHLERVGRRASARGAFATAAEAHRRAAALTVDRSRLPPRLLLAAEAGWLAGSADDARALLDRALLHQPEPLVRGRIEELRGAIETRCGSLESALATLVRAAEGAAPVSAEMAVRLLADAVHVCFYLGDPRSAVLASLRIDELLVGVDDERARFLGSVAEGMAAILSGAGRDGVATLRRAVDLLSPEEERADQLRLPQRIVASLWLRDTSARRLLGGTVQQLRDQAALGSLPYLLMHIARDDATTDRWDDAEAGYLEAIQLALETGQNTDLATALAGLVWLRARQGRAEECTPDIVTATELAHDNQIHMAAAWLDFARGDLADAVGRPGDAVVHYERLQSWLDATGLGDPDLSPVPELVETYLRLGRGAETPGLCESFAAKAEAKDQPWSLARAARTLAVCSADGRSEEHFLAALELHAKTPDTYETARTRLAYGAWLRRHRRRADAREHLRAAVADFEDLGAVPWADRAAGELAASGETARRRGTTALDALTPQERQVAQLLAEGRTTRSAAASLFLSPKTVEYHLRHVYLKLDIHSREELTAALAR